MSKKIKIEDLKKFAKQLGGECLSEEYKGCHNKYLWKTPSGRILEMSWRVASKGQWIRNNREKYNICDLKDHADKKGGECLSTEYSNNKQKYKWKCNCGNEWEAAWMDVKAGGWCMKCAAVKRGKEKRAYTIVDLQEYAKNKGGECLSIAYKSSISNYVWKCSKDHIFETKWAYILHTNSWCPKCSGSIKKTIEEVRSFVESQSGYLISDTYVNCLEKLEVKCNKNHQWKVSWHALSQGRWCPKCSNSGTSRTEQEIIEIIKLYNYEVVESYKPNFLKGKHLDIFISDLKLSIEYCGLYWHSEDSPEPRDKNYHNTKRLLCEQNGIRLITVFEDEWLDRKDQVLNFLKSVLQVYDKRVYARDCTIKRVPKEEYSKFMKDNHIQGNTPAQIMLGLYHQNELIAAIGGGKHHRQNQKEFVLSRLVFKDGHQVVGGASRLVKYLERQAKELGYDKMISWSDNRWSQGNVYQATGFTLEKELPPDYSYLDQNNTRKRISKQACQKKDLLTKGAKGHTESEMARSLGLSKIWDCGKKRWTKILK